MIPIKKGDIVDIIAPAGFFKEEDAQKGLEEIKKWGLIPRMSIDFSAYHPFHSDEDQVRLSDLKRAIEAPDSKIIWCLRGGYGSARLLPSLLKIKKPKNKKIVIGHSDITALHAFFTDKWKWKTIHGPTISTFSNNHFDQNCFKELKALLFGLKKKFSFSLSPLNDASLYLRPLAAPLVGGNLAIIQTLLGTPFELNLKGRILILEDVNERGYKLDRMLNHLVMSGTLKGCKGIILGDFWGGDEGSGENFVDFSLGRFAHQLKIPVFKSSEFGHGNTNRPLVLNGNYKIEKNLLKYS